MYLRLAKDRFAIRVSLRTVCAWHDWCSPHKTTYKQQDERRRTSSGVYGGTMRSDWIMYNAEAHVPMRRVNLLPCYSARPLPGYIGRSIMRIIFRSGSRGGKIHLCPLKRYKNGDAVLPRVQDSAIRARKTRSTFTASTPLRRIGPCVVYAR